MIHLLYHANCCDGFASACIASHSLQASQSQSLVLSPIGYDDAQQCPSEINPGDHVYYLDYTPPRNIIIRLLAASAQVTIIDHHKTAQPILFPIGPAERLNVLFDTEHSGAALTWQHFSGTPTIVSAALSLNQCIPLLRHYDLGHVWNDPKHPLTNEARWLVAYLMRCLPRTPQAWLPVLLNFEAHRETALNTGAVMWNKDLRYIRAFARHPHWVNVGGFEVPALNGIPYALLNDALAEMLIEHPDAAFAAAWSVLPDEGVIKWSLRGRKGGMDLGAFCQSLDPTTEGKPGGGGHPQSAGFSTTDPVHFL
jgi:hypothetical protein